MRTLVLLLLPILCFAQKEILFESSPAIEIANDKVALTVMKTGAAFARVILKDDPAATNPLWEPIRMARELGETRSQAAIGHFICVDGFGPVSPEEQAAGLPGHGEACRRPMEVVTAGYSGGTMTLTLRAELPIVREVLTRTCRIVDGENVIYVDSELENLLGFDRPVVWAEHATIGSPFLAPEITAVDFSAARSQVRPVPPGQKRPHLLVSGKDFTWPMAPAVAGGLLDFRTVPAHPDSLDHTTSLMDPNRELEFVTAINLEKRLLIGYLFRRREYPWLQTWDNFPASLKMSRGIEFSTQPYDVPRRESISLGRMFGAPTYRWLPAKSKITTSFLMFYTHVPEDFRKVDDARLAHGKLILEDFHSGKTIVLPASRGL